MPDLVIRPALLSDAPAIAYYEHRGFQGSGPLTERKMQGFLVGTA